MAISKGNPPGSETPTAEPGSTPARGRPVTPARADVGGNGQAALPAGRITDERRQLPTHEGKLSRIQNSAQQAVGTLKEWVDLRIELVKTEIDEMIAEKQQQAKFGAILGVFAALVGLFVLLTLGFVFSAVFEGVLGWAQLTALAAGYGVVSVLLAAVAYVAYRKSPFS